MKRNKKKQKSKKGLIILLVLLLISIASIYLYANYIDNNTYTIAAVSLNSPIENSTINEKDYKYIELDSEDIHKGTIILVNNDLKYIEKENNKLASIFDYKTKSYKVSNKNILVNYNIMKYLNNLLDDFYEATKKDDVLVCSGYRSIAEQTTIYENRDDAKEWVASPGYSEHHTGYAVDFSIFSNFGINTDYTGKGKYGWIVENTYKYGFILRYPENKVKITGINFEPWHFRYIGMPHAYIVKQKGFCLEEYIEYIKEYEFNDKHLLVNDGEINYEIYFVKAASDKVRVPVPKNSKYEISGNNIDGFIVTVKKN